MGINFRGNTQNPQKKFLPAKVSDIKVNTLDLCTTLIPIIKITIKLLISIIKIIIKLLKPIIKIIIKLLIPIIKIIIVVYNEIYWSYI